MGGGGRFPYPKEVWTPSGGWWTRPKNWQANTAVSLGMIGAAVYFTWKFSAENEVRHRPPTHWIPSMMWAKQFTSGDMGVRNVDGDEKPAAGSASH